MHDSIQSVGQGSGARIKIAVVGLGRTGWRNHLNRLEGLPGQYEIVGACDPMPERRGEASARYGCQSYASVQEMLERCPADWVVIATPTPLHEEQVIASLRAGYHVLCEKPMAGDLRSAHRMADMAAKSGRHLTVFHNRRYAADFLKVREVIASGCLGRLLLIKISVNTFARRWDWQTLRKNLGGSLLNAGPHFLDQAIQLLDGGIPDVRCCFERALTSGDAEDHVRIFLETQGGPSIEIELSNADAFGADRWKIYGTSGGLCGSDKAFRWRYTDWAGLPERRVEDGPSADRTYNREVIPWVEESWAAEPGAPPKETRFYNDLYHALANGEPPPITLEEALGVVELTERCMDSTESDAMGQYQNHCLAQSKSWDLRSYDAR